MEGELTVTDGSRTIKTKIIGKGNLRYSTPISLTIHRNVSL
jgi:hypothetical protein